MRRQSFGRREGTTADEWDAFTGWRKYVFWHRGELRKIKRARHKRERKAGQSEARRGAFE